jgi:hypothetical protein
MLLTRLHMITHHRPQGFIVPKRLGDVVSSSSYSRPLKEEGRSRPRAGRRRSRQRPGSARLPSIPPAKPSVKNR